MKNKKLLGMAGHVWNQSFMYCDLYFYDRGNCNEGRQWLGTGPGCGFHRYAGGSQSAGSVLSAGVYCVFCHGLIGFLGKHKIEEINFHVLRAIRKNKKNRWVAVWAIFPAIPTALFLWEGITEKLSGK